MPNGNEKKRVKSGDKPDLGLKVASKEYQDTPVSETVVNGKEYAGTLYQKKYKPMSASTDTVTNFMDEGGPEQYLRGPYESRKSPYKKKATAAAAKKSSNSVVIDEIASKYRSR